MKDWLTLKEASNITGKSIQSIRMLVKRKKNVKAKKTRQKGHEIWVIHKDEVNSLTSQVKDNVKVNKEGSQSGDHVNLISFEAYIQHRTEWDKQRSQLEQGVLMYRWKFEEADRKLKLLPAPVEIVAHDLQEKTTRLQEKEQELLHVKAEKTTLSDTLHEAQERLQKTEEDREDISIKLTEKTANMGKLEEERKILEDRLDKLNAKLEAERGKPWWKKLFGMK